MLPTPPEKHGKNCKTQLWDEKQNRSFFGPPYMLDEIESKTMYKDKKGD